MADAGYVRGSALAEAPPSPSLHPMTHGELLRDAIAGKEDAWHELVERFSDFVWSIARGFRLDPAAAADVSQTVWLKLLEKADSIEDPERLPGWLATATKREAMRVVRLRSREPLVDFEWEPPDAVTPTLDAMLIEDEEVRGALLAFGALTERCQHLLRLLLAEPPLSYEEISDLAEMPVGSIGPTRARCVEQLVAGMSTDRRKTTGGSND